jgi:CcdB protein
VRRFDICEVKPHGLVVVLQHDATSGFATRIVAPLSTHIGSRSIDRVRLYVAFEGNNYVIQLDRMAAIDIRQLGAVRGSLADIQDEIKNGIDLLLFGF